MLNKNALLAASWRAVVCLFDLRGWRRKLNLQKALDVVFVTNMRDSKDRRTYLGNLRPKSGHFNGPRYWLGKIIIGRTRALDVVAKDLEQAEARELAKERFISATAWAQKKGAIAILLAAGTKRLFDDRSESNGTVLKEKFPDLLFTIGDNGTLLLLRKETLRALKNAKLQPDSARIAVLGPYGFLGEMMTRTLVNEGYTVIGAGPRESKLAEIAYKYGIETCTSLDRMGKVDAVIACTHSDKVELNENTIPFIRKDHRKLLVVDVAEPSNLKRKAYDKVKDVVIRQDAGNAFSPRLSYVLGAVSYKMFRLSKGVTFGCFAETMALAHALKTGNRQYGDLTKIDWFAVNDENMAIVDSLFREVGFTIPSPRCFGKEVKSFDLDIKPKQEKPRVQKRFTIGDTDRWDVIVVGSGAGGGTLARELTKKGKKVLLIEAGPFIPGSHVGNFWQSVIFNGYYHRMAAFSMSQELTTIYHTKNVGGSTVFACGNMVRSLEQDFRRLGIDLSEAFLQAEKDLNVAPVVDKQIVTATRRLMKASNNGIQRMHPMPKGMAHARSCNLCGDCVLGCNRNAKWDARPFVDEAISDGLMVLPSTKVERILLDNRGYARGVEIVFGKTRAEVEAGKVVVCAGGLNTPVILQKSNIGAGEGLFVDFFNATYGLSKGALQTKGASMGTVIMDRHESEGFILSPYLDHWSQMMLFCPFWSSFHALPMKRTMGIMTKITDERIGRVSVNGRISKTPTLQDKARLRAGAKEAAKILKDAGARSITTTTNARGAHPGGTAAVGEVVGHDLRVIGTENVYVCDASVFPKTPGLPPILTIVALGKWLSDQI